MNEAEFKFSREGIEGIAPVGASLASVMRRFGIRLPSDCDVDLDEHYCSVTVSDGGSLLSPISTAERNISTGISVEQVSGWPVRQSSQNPEV